MLNFDFNNKTKSKINIALVKEINSVFFKFSGLKKEWEYSLAYVGETKIRDLNRVLRGKDKVTDVLSFEEENGEELFNQNDGAKHLGEIIICPSRARNQAKKYGWSYDREIARLLIHGLSHLLGYDHENVTEKEAKKMVDFEEKIMDSVKFKK